MIGGIRKFGGMKFQSIGWIQPIEERKIGKSINYKTQIG